MADKANIRLQAWAFHRALAEISLGASEVDGHPIDWHEDAHWACINGHVCGTYVTSDEHGRQCLRCGEDVTLIEPISQDDFAPIAALIREGTDE